MLNHFKTIQANSQSIQPRILADGREWYEMVTTCWDDMECQAGGSPRAQFQSLPYMPKNKTQHINFDLIIPYGWVQDDVYVLIHDIHSRHVGGLPMVLYITQDKFLAVYKTGDTTAVAAEYEMHWVHEHVYQFRITTHIDTDQSGYADCQVNGQPWYYYKGPTMFEGEDPVQGPYWKVGPYVATQNWADEDCRRLFVRL